MEGGQLVCEEGVTTFKLPYQMCLPLFAFSPVCMHITIRLITNCTYCEVPDRFLLPSVPVRYAITKKNASQAKPRSLKILALLTPLFTPRGLKPFPAKNGKMIR